MRRVSGPDEERHDELVEVETRLADEVAQRRRSAQPAQTASPETRSRCEAYARVRHTTADGSGLAQAAARIVALALAARARVGRARRGTAQRRARRTCERRLRRVRADTRCARVATSGARELLRSPEDRPTTASPARLNAAPLRRRPATALLTGSGVYYLPFGWPSQFGAQTVALHVADGSGDLREPDEGPEADDRRRRRRTRALRQLPRAPGDAAAPRRLPAVARDAATSTRAACATAQESFAARIRETRSLVSFVRLTRRRDARRSCGEAHVRRRAASHASRGRQRSSRRRARTCSSSDGARVDGTTVVVRRPGTAERSVYVGVARRSRAGASASRSTRTATQRARHRSSTFWARKLAGGATFDVPEARVQDAAAQPPDPEPRARRGATASATATRSSRSPEAIDAAGSWASTASQDVDAAILDVARGASSARYANWQMGEQLLGSARLLPALPRPRVSSPRTTPTLARYVARLGRADRREQAPRCSPRALLVRHRRDRSTGSTRRRSCGRACARWRRCGPRPATRRSQRGRARSPRGSAPGCAARAQSERTAARRLAVRPGPRCSTASGPTGALTDSRPGSYWNLVMPYALASGLFAPDAARRTGVLALHAAPRLAAARARPRRRVRALRPSRASPSSGTDQVYGLNVARFLADNDQADQLVLSLYGQLAARR